MKFDLDKLIELKKEWHSLFDQAISHIENNGGIILPTTPIYDYIMVEPYVRVRMKLHSLRIITGLLIDKHILLEYLKEDGEIKEVLVCRAFEAKSFGLIRHTRQSFKWMVEMFNLYGFKDMKKANNSLKNGAFVSAVKSNGEKFLGIFDHSYDNYIECCVLAQDNKKFCVKTSTVKLADEEESKIIQETIVKPRKEAEKARKKAQQETSEELTEEDLEEAVETTETAIEE